MDRQRQSPYRATALARNLEGVTTTLTMPAPRALHSRARLLVPGLALSAAGVAVAAGVNRLVPVAGPLTVAILLGVLVVNARLLPASCVPGTRYAAKTLRRAGVVLLGLQLALSDVLSLGPGLLGTAVSAVFVTFAVTWWLGRRLGVPPGQTLLIATGSSICGASAIAAVDAVCDTDEQDVAVGIGVVTLFGTAAILVLPMIQGVLGLAPETYGAWVGASTHEVSQVVAAAAVVPGAVGVAVVVKLMRVVLLAPLVAGLSLSRRGAASERTALVPMFVIGFLVAVALRATGLVPEPVLHASKTLETLLLAAAMFGLGTGVSARMLVRTGWRPLALGLATWLVIGTVAFTGVALTT